MAAFDFTTHDTLPLLCRAWSDNVSSRRRIPKNWEEAMRHPSLRALSQRSTRRFASVASSVFSRTLRIQVSFLHHSCRFNVLRCHMTMEGPADLLGAERPCRPFTNFRT